MDRTRIRNVAIIAHVDHGKTTLVDQLFRQSGMFRENQDVAERLMDSMDLEKERGITIASKNGSYQYKDFWINIVDTPGHADFGGQVERILRMADGCLLLVDAQEGPMPQTYFVLKKALALSLPSIVVINKIDKPAARCDWVVDQVFDLFVKLGATDDLLDFPVLYASAKQGFALRELDEKSDNIHVVSDYIISEVPYPAGDAEAPLQMQVNTIDYSPYMGRLGIGRVVNGTLRVNKDIAVTRRDDSISPIRIFKIFRFQGNEKVSMGEATAGEIVAVAGMEDVTVGVTFTDAEKPVPLPIIEIDPPTLSINFIPNDSPFTGLEGKFVTSRHIEDRLQKEVLSDVALGVGPIGIGFKVSGRGELHLSILIEKMRREGYEFQVTRPEIIMKEENGVKLEPYEELTINIDEEFQGVVIEKLGRLKGQMEQMETDNGTVKLVYKIPTRGLLGFRSRFLTDTKGTGIMNYRFSEYGPYAGDIVNRVNGVLIVKKPCKSVAYALFNLQDRGRLFIGPGTSLYAGQIIGEHARPADLVVNPAKGKKLTNMRASGSDEAVILTPPVRMSLEDCLAYINDDELVEVTPESIRLRKQEGGNRKP